jgi:mono/diheme cytochrome c family protein
MTPITKTTLLCAAALSLLATATGRAVTMAPPASTQAQAADAKAQAADAKVLRGAYLVDAMSCHDCHTPWVMGPRGPEPDMSRALTGHPADLVMPPPPAPSGPWVWSGAGTNTAFAGPWGVSFTMNLTPDMETGLGKWTDEIFIATMKTGRHEGKGRPLLPPMPYFSVAALTDEDMRAVFAYLRSLAPVRNRVPAPIDPPEEP